MPKIAKRETFKIATIADARTFLAHGEEYGFTHATVILTQYAPKKERARKPLEVGTPGKVHLADARPGKVRSLPV
jgi:hypothetical protein